MGARDFKLYVRLVAGLSDQYAAGVEDPRERFTRKAELAQRVYDAILDTGDPDPFRFPPRRRDDARRSFGVQV